MTTFYLSAFVLVIVTLALLLRPWRKTGQVLEAANAALNAAIHRDRLTELERDHASGAMDAAAFEVAKRELQRQLLDDTADTHDDAATAPSTTTRTTARRSLWVIGLLVPIAAVALYAVIGNRQALLTPEEANRQAQHEMAQRIEALAKKMEKEPTAEGLVILARSYKSLERWDDAIRTFERIGPDLEKNAPLLAEFAETLAQKDRSLEGRPSALIQKALSIDPQTPLALYLAGSEAIAKRRYGEAVSYWEKLLPQLEPDGEDARMISNMIATAKERVGAESGKPSTPRKAVAGKTLSGRVELATALKSKVGPNDVLFVLARAVNGPRMPLAVIRAQAKDLPFKFTLDDSQAMSGEMTLSRFEEVRIEARISKTGLAVANKGDLIGKSAVIKPSAKGIRIVIEDEVQ